MSSGADNVILMKTFEFSLAIIRYAELLDQLRKWVVGNQLLKSGTSIGANVHEAQNAESKSDFIHKFKVAAKEVEETKYWLILCEKSENYPDCSHLQKMLSKLKRSLIK